LDRPQLYSYRPLPFLAATWGQEDLIQSLVDHGVDFHDVDENGWTALHYLNISASEAMVRQMRDLCEGLPLWTDHGYSPAETILQNTKLYYGDGHPLPSAHPSCSAVLTRKTYNALLTPKVLAQQNFGRTLWASVCEIAVEYFPSEEPVRREDFLSSLREPLDEDFGFLGQSFSNALACLIEKGAMAAHESAKGSCGILCLSGADGSEWPASRHELIYGVLAVAESPLLDEFYRTEQASKLLSAAQKHNHLRLLSHLTGRNVPRLDQTRNTG
jgi:hypothetical protein